MPPWRWWSSGRALADRALAGHLARAGDDVVDEAVVPRLVRGEPAVAVGVALDLLDRLAGVVGDPLLHRALRVKHLLGLDRDVGRGAADPAGRLVHHDPRVRQGVALAPRTRAKQELAHRRGQPQRDRGDVVLDVLHRVVDRHAGAYRPAGGVDVEVDVAHRVLGGEQQELGADRVGDLVLDDRAEEDNAVLEQAVEHPLVQPRTARGRPQGRDGDVAHGALLWTGGRAWSSGDDTNPRLGWFR